MPYLGNYDQKTESDAKKMSLFYLHTNKAMYEIVKESDDKSLPHCRMRYTSHISKANYKMEFLLEL